MQALQPSANTTDARAFDRIRWRARRGLLENDLLLQPFLADALEQLSAAELRVLDKLLQLSDNDLLDVLMGRKEAADDPTALIVERIRAAKNQAG
ncbi:MAG: succinate dehydrogenase assembly factor 2 [Nitrosomonadaceae bacterium]|jgi:antitoxin CptB|nr:succinate dehydrogenase assembly factor 2 [Nitrosomonadaceae bacterium]